MTNWFLTHDIPLVYGFGPSKRMILQAGYDTDTDPRELTDKAREEGCVYVEIRCFEDYSAYRPLLEQAGFTYEPHYDVLIDPSRPVPDAKMRQIRRAIAEGYSWRETTDEHDIEAWYRCLHHLYWHKVKRPVPGLNFFRDLILHKGCKLLVVEKGGIVAGGVLLAVEDDRRKAYEWYICGQVMSTWAAIEWCRQHGVQVFDTMGAGRPGVPYSVRDFKLQMGGTLVEYGRYRCVLKPLLYRLGCLLMG